MANLLVERGPPHKRFHDFDVEFQSQNGYLWMFPMLCVLHFLRKALTSLTILDLWPNHASLGCANHRFELHIVSKILLRDDTNDNSTSYTHPSLTNIVKSILPKKIWIHELVVAGPILHKVIHVLHHLLAHILGFASFEDLWDPIKTQLLSSVATSHGMYVG